MRGEGEGMDGRGRGGRVGEGRMKGKADLLDVFEEDALCDGLWLQPLQLYVHLEVAL